jgi:hypothetical protein
MIKRMHVAIIIAGCAVVVGIIVYYLLSQKKESYSNTYTPDDFIISKLKKDITLIDPQFKNLDVGIGPESYTQNKSKIYLCLSPKKGEKKYYNYNMLLYVLLHELAHYTSKSYDPQHTSEEFNSNFNSLLYKAKELNLYDDTEPVVDGYCM